MLEQYLIGKQNKPVLSRLRAFENNNFLINSVIRLGILPCDKVTEVDVLAQGGYLSGF